MNIDRVRESKKQLERALARNKGKSVDPIYEEFANLIRILNGIIKLMEVRGVRKLEDL